jgi:hypothetical protein
VGTAGTNSAHQRADREQGDRGQADTERYRVLLDRLGATSAKLASAFMDMAPAVAYRAGYDALGLWADMGERLANGGWTNLGLATRLFHQTPRLLELIDMEELDLLVRCVTALSSRAPEMAVTCLRDAEVTLEMLAPQDRRSFLVLLHQVVQRSWAEADRCLEQVPKLLEGVDPSVRTPLLGLAAAAVQAEGPGAFATILAATEALGGLPVTLQDELMAEGCALVAPHPLVGLELLAGAPAVVERLEPDAARRWRAAGCELLGEPGGHDRATAWFRLESAQARDLLAALAGRVELAEVASLLRLYAQALTGRELILQPVGVLAARGLGWSASSGATTDGTSVFLPPSIDAFDAHDANLAAYKVHITLQAARLTHGSFEFRLGVDGAHLPAEVQGRPTVTPTDPRWPDMHQLYARFPRRRLFSWLFALAEGTRIDAVAAREYPGIRAALDRLRDRAAADRAGRSRWSAPQAFAESLVLESLGHPSSAPMELPGTARELLHLLRLPGATVQDAAEVAAALYDLAVAIPEEVPRADRSAGQPTGEAPLGEELAQPDLHGDYRPETVQVLDLFDDVDEHDRIALTHDELADLLSDVVEMQGEDGPLGRAEVEALLEELERRAAEESEQAEDAAPADGTDAEEPEDPDHGADAPEVTWFHYDEWDHKAHDYRHGHCRLGERAAPEGPPGAYEDSLSQHHSLVVQTRRRFEQLRPEAFRKISRLEDGSDIDLDEAIAFHADKLAGAGPLARFYTRRNKIVRDVAVALLIDQSASTREPAADGERRVIDVVRDATVLMVEAIEATGDAYGIYGFSGQGHQNVELLVVKELDQPLDDVVRRRVGGIEPLGATRMGPAIRHTVAKLDDVAAKVKLLILVSDGRPEDEDYGPERGSIDYPLHDTRKALLEAKRRRIEPFLITVDSTGADYLAQMCDDLGYEVVADVESLPRRLARLYRHLTTE